MLKIQLFFTLLIFQTAYSEVMTFVVELKPDVIKVLSPSHYSEKSSIVVKNETAIDLIGEVVNQKEERIWSFRVNASKVVVYDLNRIGKDDRFYLRPISPPRQEVELAFGNPEYQKK